ncbi:MAG: PPC domain-containing DNA-binding protein [Desulfobacterales bacterium]
MTQPYCSEFKPGKYRVGRIPHGQDLIASIEMISMEHSIQMATFSLIGAVMSATLGAYDQKQQVYVTFKEERPLELITCIGNISLKEGKPFVHAHILLADEQGKTLGGHLFSETLIYAGEICIQEMIGEPLKREYDTTTGLMLWPAQAPDQ